MRRIPRAVAIYTRKSSKEESKQSSSHERQNSEIRSFCKRHNMVVVKEFSDTISAFNKPATDREGFMKLIDWLNEDAGHLVVMTEVSRLTRTQTTIWDFINPILHQFRFVELGDQEPNDLILGIFISLARAESDKIGSRVKSAYQLRLKKYGKGNFAWGNPNIKDHAEKGRRTILKKVVEFWEPILIVDAYLYKLGRLKQGERVEQLNKLGHRTRNNKPITASNLCKAHRILETGGVVSLAERII